MTQFRLFSLILGLGLLVATPALAEDATGRSDDALRTAIKAKREASASALKDYQSAQAEKKLAKLIAFGDKAVDERTSALGEQKKQVASKGCPATTTTAITAAFATASTALATKKASIDASKTVDDLKTSVKDVFQSNRVYMFLIPASRGACISQKLIDLIDGKLTTAINQIKAAGIDTTAIEAKLATARTDAQSALDIYMQVIKTPGGDDAGNRAKMAAAKALLQNVRKTLGDVKSDIGNLMGEYQQKTKSTDDATPVTAPVTPTP